MIPVLITAMKLKPLLKGVLPEDSKISPRKKKYKQIINIHVMILILVAKTKELLEDHQY